MKKDQNKTKIRQDIRDKTSTSKQLVQWLRIHILRLLIIKQSNQFICLDGKIYILHWGISNLFFFFFFMFFNRLEIATSHWTLKLGWSTDKPCPIFWPSLRTRHCTEQGVVNLNLKFLLVFSLKFNILFFVLWFHSFNFISFTI
jgi:hypothetical protein